MILKQKSILPGFGLSFGFTVVYLGIIVLLPLGVLVLKGLTIGWSEFLKIVLTSRAVAAYKLSFSASFCAAMISAVFGLIVAWVLVRYEFFGKKVIDAFVDFPFALPTAVAGISLTAVYAPNGWIGQFFSQFGMKIAFTPIGIVIALIFIGLPFVVRTVEPVLQDIDAELEEAAASLGANRWQTFMRVIFPNIFPALITGFTLAFARAIGEYGSIVFIAGNMPYKTEIVPLLIMTKLEQYDYAGAVAIALVMLGFSFILLLTINILQTWSRSRLAMK